MIVIQASSRKSSAIAWTAFILTVAVFVGFGGRASVKNVTGGDGTGPRTTKIQNGTTIPQPETLRGPTSTGGDGTGPRKV